MKYKQKSSIIISLVLLLSFLANTSEAFSLNKKNENKTKIEKVKKEPKIQKVKKEKKEKKIMLKSVTIGVTFSSLESELAQNLKKYLGEITSEHGMKLVMENASNDSEMQQTHITNFFKKRYKVIIVYQLLDTNVAEALTSKAVKSNTKLIYINSFLNESSIPKNKNVVQFYSSPYNAGQGQVAYILNQIKDENIDRGHLGLLVQDLNDKEKDLMAKGIKDDLENKNPLIKIYLEKNIESGKDDAYATVKDWLERGETFLAILTNKPSLALDAVRALNEADINNMVYVGSVDKNDQILESIQKKDVNFTLYQNYYTVTRSLVDLIINMMRKKPFEQNIVIPFEIIDTENVKNYMSTKATDSTNSDSTNTDSTKIAK